MYFNFWYSPAGLYLLLLFSRTVMYDSLWPHGLEHMLPHHLFPLLHHLPELAQILVHWISDAIQLSHPVTPFSSCLQYFLVLRPFLMSWLFPSGRQSIGPSVSVLPMNIQDWFPLQLTGLISLHSEELSRVFSSTMIQKHQFCGISLLYGPTLTSLHDYWKNNSFDYTDLCQQSEVSANPFINLAFLL